MFIYFAHIPPSFQTLNKEFITRSFVICTYTIRQCDEFEFQSKAAANAVAIEFIIDASLNLTDFEIICPYASLYLNVLDFSRHHKI